MRVIPGAGFGSGASPGIKFAIVAVELFAATSSDGAIGVDTWVTDFTAPVFTTNGWGLGVTVTFESRENGIS